VCAPVSAVPVPVRVCACVCVCLCVYVNVFHCIFVHACLRRREIVPSHHVIIQMCHDCLRRRGSPMKYAGVEKMKMECVCMCVYERQTERERLRVCVCVYEARSINARNMHCA